jgi:hypothetical protein
MSSHSQLPPNSGKFRELFERMPSRSDVSAELVAMELAALRTEITALREQLSAPKSVILTGAEVERVFASLKGGTA